MAFTVNGHKVNAAKAIVKAAGMLDWAKAPIGEALKWYTQASIAWTAICLVLPLLTNPVTADEAKKSGFRHITARIKFYTSFGPMLRPLGQNPAMNQDLVEKTDAPVVSLCQSILEFQFESVFRFYRSRFADYIRAVTSLDDCEGRWKRWK